MKPSRSAMDMEVLQLSWEKTNFIAPGAAVKSADGTHLETQRHRRRDRRARRPLSAGGGGDRRRHPLQPAGRAPRRGRIAGRRRAREALEETAHRFLPEYLVGIYQWRRPDGQATYLRFAFGGKLLGVEAERALDHGILRALWLTPEEIAAERSRHRSPLVMQCVRDYLAGRRFGLDLITHYENMSKGTVVVGMSGGVDSSVAAMLLKQQGWKVVGLFMKNWEDDDDDGVLLHPPGPDRCRRGLRHPRHRPRGGELLGRVQGARLQRVPARVPGRAHAQPRRAVQRRNQVQGLPRPRPGAGAEKIATGHYAQVREVPTEMGTEFQLLKAEDGTKDQSYFLYRLNQAQLSKTLFPLGEVYKREVRKMAERPACPTSPRRTRPASASSASGRSRNFWSATCRASPARSARWTATSGSASTTA
jgi:hypothetical protein